MWEIDYGKIIMTSSIIISLTVAMILSKIDSTVYLSVISFILGKLYGNGVNAIKGVQPKGFINKPHTEE